MHEVQLRDAKARLSALVEGAAHGETAIITRYGKPRAVILGVDEWNRLRPVPSFGRLLLSVCCLRTLSGENSGRWGS